MSSVIKAVRAQITLGDIELDVFQLPDGSYVMSSTQIAELMGRTEKYYRPKYLSKELQALLGERLATVQSLTKVAFESTRINPLPLDVVGICFAFEASKGNQTALGLVVASQIESLERRADAAFGVLRTEEERNQRFATRLEGICSRHFWTDTIYEYIKTHDVSDNYIRFIYTNVSDCVNLKLFGMKAKKVREYFGLSDGLLLRDFLPSETLKIIDTIEKATAVRVRQTDSEPLQALKDVISLLGIEPDSSRL